MMLVNFKFANKNLLTKLLDYFIYFDFEFASFVN